MFWKSTEKIPLINCYANKSNETKKIVTASVIKAVKKMISATRSSLFAIIIFSDRIDRNDRIQLTIKNMADKPVISSMTVP
jgi:hypothetical protein